MARQIGCLGSFLAVPLPVNKTSENAEAVVTLSGRGSCSKAMGQRIVPDSYTVGTGPASVSATCSGTGLTVLLPGRSTLGLAVE